MTRRARPVFRDGPHRRRHLLRGTAWGMVAEGLALPTGLITAGFLTRYFGASDYGFYALTIGVVGLLQGGINSLLARTTIKFASEADDLDPVARTVIRLHLAVGLGVALGVVLAAPAIASLLGEAELTGLLRIYSLSLPVASLTQSHIHLLVGSGRFDERALVRTVLWSTRLVFVVGLVLLGFGIQGALAGVVIAHAAALVLARRWVRPSIFGPAFPVRPLFAFAIPLFIAGTAAIASRSLDLLALKTLGGTAADAGLYSAAQTLALVTGILSTALTPLLLSTMNRAAASGNVRAAQDIGRDFLRGGLWLLPLTGLVTGVSSDVMTFVYGPGFGAAGLVLAILFLSSSTVILTSTCQAILIVTDRMREIVIAAVIPLITAVLLYPVLIPPFASTGAALSTLSGKGVAVAIGLLLVWRAWRVAAPIMTVMRSLILTGGAYWVASSWTTSLVWLLPRMAVVSVGIAVGFVLLGEWKVADLRKVAVLGTAGFRDLSGSRKDRP